MAINITLVNSEVATMGGGWAAEENEISQLSDADFQALLGYAPDPRSGELLLEAREAVAEVAMRAMMTMQAAPAAEDAPTAPAAYDLRNVGGRNFITPVRNQQSCGSCVSFGCLAAVEGTTRVARNDPSFAIDLSEGHLFQCIARSQGRRCQGANAGWWVDPALRALQDQGVVDEACSPYNPAEQACTLCANWQQRVVKIRSYQELRGAAQMKEWLSTRGPLVACYSVYSDFAAYRSGVYRRTPSSVLRGGHCICVVGYDDAQGAWICKNSWGTGWGEQGYFRIAYGQCGIDASMWGVVAGATPTPGGRHVPLYRYWNPGIGDHFYTTSWAELGAGRHGWGYEGVQCFIDATASAGLVPLYRYWNPGIGDHFYTTSWAELGAGRHGWGYEGVQGYVASAQRAGTVPLYRYWNAQIGDHFYTTSWHELQGGRHGWAYEGIQCYVWTAATAAAEADDSEQVPATFQVATEMSGDPGLFAGTPGSFVTQYGTPETFTTAAGSVAPASNSAAAPPATFASAATTQRGCGCKEPR